MRAGGPKFPSTVRRCVMVVSLFVCLLPLTPTAPIRLDMEFTIGSTRRYQMLPVVQVVGPQIGLHPFSVALTVCFLICQNLRVPLMRFLLRPDMLSIVLEPPGWEPLQVRVG